MGVPRPRTILNFRDLVKLFFLVTNHQVHSAVSNVTMAYDGTTAGAEPSTKLVPSDNVVPGYQDRNAPESAKMYPSGN